MTEAEAFLGFMGRPCGRASAESSPASCKEGMFPSLLATCSLLDLYPLRPGQDRETPAAKVYHPPGPTPTKEDKIVRDSRSTNV